MTPRFATAMGVVTPKPEQIGAGARASTPCFVHYQKHERA